LRASHDDHDRAVEILRVAAGDGLGTKVLQPGRPSRAGTAATLITI
jgi:hypothetical protein